MDRRSFTKAAAALLAAPAAIGLTTRAHGQGTFPSRAITLVVPWAPGGSQDAFMRVLAPPLGAELGQPVVIENRAGASGTIGSAAVANARADGYTVLVGSSSTFSMAPHLYQLPYETERAFTAVGLIATMPIMMIVPSQLEARTVAEFVDLVKRSGGRISYASSGVGSSTHLATEMFLQMAGIEVPDITYRGGGPATQALLTGETQMTFQTAATVLGFMRSGHLRALAVATRERIPLTPDVPTFAESGFPDFEVAENIALLAPTGTPEPVLGRIHSAVAKVMALPQVQERLSELAIIPTVRRPEEFPAFMAAESAKWRDLIRARNIRVQ